jgi:chitin synthase
LQRLTLTGKEAWCFLIFGLRLNHIASRVLRYVKGAVGETDVPEGLPEFINQRRRWLNGSFFAATYALAHIGQMLSSGHSVSRKVVLSIQALYNAINLIASWFAIVSTIPEAMLMILSDRTKGNFYLFFVILSSSLEAPSFHMHPIRYLNSVVQVLSPYIRAVFNLMWTFVLVPLGFHCHCLLSVRHGQQTTIVSYLK